MRARPLAALLAASTLVGCGDGERLTWSDADASVGLPVVEATTVVEGDGWRFDVGIEPVDTGATARPCLQLVVAEQPLGCITVDAEEGAEYSSGTTTRVDDERVIWRASTTIDTEPPVDHFVVWSSASPNGRRVDPIRYGDVESLLWIMEPGEAPWGYQAIGPDGTLVAHESYVGLPAD